MSNNAPLTCDQVPGLLAKIGRTDIDSTKPQYSSSITLPEQLRFLKQPTSLKSDDIKQICKDNDMFCKEKGGDYCNDCEFILQQIIDNQTSEDEKRVTAWDGLCLLQYNNSNEATTKRTRNATQSDTITANATTIKDTNTTIDAQLKVLQNNTDKINYLNQQLSANNGQMDQDNKKKFIGFVYANLGIEMSNKSYFYSLLTIDMSLAILFIYLLFKKAN
jgi:hypothetical protein